MNDEIKEILDRLYVYRNENDEMKYQPEDILTIEDVWLLLDYITNLQKENQRLKEENNKLINEPTIMKMSRIDSVVANIYRNHKEQEDYKSRCEKAIEYIHNHQLVFELSSKKQIQDWFDMFYKDSLNILNGGDE